MTKERHQHQRRSAQHFTTSQVPLTASRRTACTHAPVQRLTVLGVARVPLVPAPNTELHNPRNDNNKHEPRRSPCQAQELASPLGLDANVVSVLVDNIRALDHDSRHERAGKSNRYESQRCDQEVDASGEATRGQDGDNSGDHGDEDEADGDDVEHKHGGHERVERIDAVLDVFWPFEVLERDVQPALVQALLDDARRVEAIHGLGRAAVGDALADVALRYGCVGDFGGRVLALAVVEHVRRVPVLDSQASSHLADLVVDVLGDFVGDVVEQVGDRVRGVRGAVFLEESFAQEGGVKLVLG
jgi:hypothetical protein